MIDLSTLRTLAEYASDSDVRGQCSDALRELESRYWTLRDERLDVVACMAHEGNGDRPTIDHAPSSIAAGEVRVTKRQPVRRSEEYIAKNRARIATTDPSYFETLQDASYSSSAPKRFKDQFDTTCYRVSGLPAWLTQSLSLDMIRATWPAHVSVIEPPEKERKTRKPSTTVADRAKVQASLLRTIAGTIRMGEQD